MVAFWKETGNLAFSEQFLHGPELKQQIPSDVGKNLSDRDSMKSRWVLELSVVRPIALWDPDISMEETSLDGEVLEV